VRRFLVLAALLALIPLSGVMADPQGGGSGGGITIAISPLSGPGSEPRELVAHGLPPLAPMPVIVFGPDGSQTVTAAHTDDKGNLDVAIAPPSGFGHDGVYRVVLDLGGGSSQSTLFAVGDGKPHLYAEPELFSPFSAFQILGSGLPPNQGFDLVLTPANGRAARTFPVSTDGFGFLQAYIWPDQLNEAFFEAGGYQVAVPALGLSAPFQVWERPIGAILSVDSTVISGDPEPLHFRRYESGRYVWAVYADSSGRVRGELVFGQTDIQGSLDASAVFPGLESGRYRLATPYDWGETAFSAIPATPTPTATATPTATPTDSPTPSVTPTPVPRTTRKVCKRVHGHKKCKRVKVAPEPRTG
jgi:hypothetical protein